jgi:hypothetical protein
MARSYIIYVYLFDNRPIYIGQTKTSFKTRDKSHLNGRTTFDKHYRANRQRYSRRVIFQTTDYVSRNTLDRLEIYCIRRFQTYTNGLNNTVGGTMTKNMALRCYAAKCDEMKRVVLSIIT